MRRHGRNSRVEKTPTTNGRVIRDMLLAEKIRGNPKDYVIISGLRLIDYNGSYDIRLENGKASPKTVFLMHKRKLHNVIGDEQARRFWRQGLGRVADKIPPLRKR